MKPLALPRWTQWLLIGVVGAGVYVVMDGGGQSADATVEVANNVKARHAVAEDRLTTNSPGQGNARDPMRVELERLAPVHPVADGSPINAFDATSWYVPPPPPPPPPPAPPPKPTAPPLPFTYLGSYSESSEPVLILSRGDRVYTVSPGDVVDGTYRVERVLGNAAELIYLPLNIKQMLAPVGA